MSSTMWFYESIFIVISVYFSQFILNSNNLLVKLPSWLIIPIHIIMFLLSLAVLGIFFLIVLIFVWMIYDAGLLYLIFNIKIIGLLLASLFLTVGIDTIYDKVLNEQINHYEYFSKILLTLLDVVKTACVIGFFIFIIGLLHV